MGVIILGDSLTLRCDTCGAQLGLGRKSLEAVQHRMPTGWMSLDKGRHSCPLCTPAVRLPTSYRY